MPVTLPSSNKKGIIVLAQAVVTKYHRLDGLSNRDLFWWSGGWKSKIKALADSVLGESLLAGLWMAAFSLRPHSMGRENSGDSYPFYKGANSIMGAHPYNLL